MKPWLHRNRPLSRWLSERIIPLLLLLTAPGLQAEPEPGYCFDQAADYYQLPVVLLKAIARHESGMNPSIINHNRNGSVDIGLMQINEWWLPRLRERGITREDLLDPCVSIYVGAWILAQNMQHTDDVWDAVGAYNAGWKAVGEKALRRKKYIEGIKRKVIALQQTHQKRMEGES